MKKIIKILSLLLVLCLLTASLAACSSQGKVLMSLGDKTLSVNFYQLLLSRMKGTLYTYGYDVMIQAFGRRSSPPTE